MMILLFNIDSIVPFSYSTHYKYRYYSTIGDYYDDLIIDTMTHYCY